MPISARYTHTNLVARDWRSLALFYQEVLSCVPVPPERDLSGPSLDAATGLPGAHITGVHLRLPGCGDDGPTLELFQYETLADGPAPALNRPGFAHLAFAVEDVAAAREAVLAAGGTALGETVTLTIADGRRVTFCYLADPEGNAVELQSWAR